MNAVTAKISELPIELKAIIEDDEIIAIIDEIAEKFNIPYTWGAELIRATIKVLSGVMKPNEFVPHIMEIYDIGQDEAMQIAQEINQKIFSAVKPQLASLYNIEDKKLASRIKVPHKPKVEIVEEPQVEQKTVIFTEKIPVMESPETINIMPTVKIENKPVAVEEKPKPIETGLSGKLDNFRMDKYREGI